VAVVSCACSPEQPVQAARDGMLVLEVGGDHGSLQKALVAAGAVVAPPHELGARADEPIVQGIEQIEPLPSPEDPPPIEAPPADHIVVRLERGQTLIHLARKHLGNGNRFREILAFNGWSERDARKLPEGQLVKVPVAPGAAPR
jgi:nucleoid-associated protein YgaU